ncbi:MAG: ribosome recycling factor [bacterium]
MKKTIESLHEELLKVRTGRANPALLNKIEVECYGAFTPINQVANIGVPSARSLVIQAWDKSILRDIEKAILKSNIGLTPLNDGKVIRINIPSLTEENRKKMVKLVKEKGEEGKISLRSLRRDVIEKIKKMEKDGKIPQDDAIKATEKIQEIIDKYTHEVEQILLKKEKEIMEF